MLTICTTTEYIIEMFEQKEDVRGSSKLSANYSEKREHMRC